MCDKRRSLSVPRWGRLYVILALAITAIAAAEFSPLGLLFRELVELAVLAATLTAALGWVRGNRVALAEMDWCSCAGAEVRIRVVKTPPDTSPIVRPALDESIVEPDTAPVLSSP